MPANLIVGYGRKDGRQGKRDPKQKEITDEAEETGERSQEMTPVGGTKKRRDYVRDYLNEFIQDAEKKLKKIRTWHEFNPEWNIRSYPGYDPTLGRRLRIARQIQMDMQMTGVVPDDSVLDRFAG